MCAVSPVVHTSNISSCQKKNFFRFPVVVNNSIKAGPLVFLLEMFVINENIWNALYYFPKNQILGLVYTHKSQKITKAFEDHCNAPSGLP